RAAGVQLARGSLEEAERYLALATRKLDSVPAGRAGRAQAVLAVVRMRQARQRGDLAAVAGEAQRLLAPAVSADPAQHDLAPAAQYDLAPAAQYDLAPAAQYDLAPAAQYDLAPAAQYDLAPAAQYDLADPAQYDLAPAAQYDLAPAAQAELGGDLRALALIDLGIAEALTARFDEANRHLDDSIALARRIGRPYLEVTGLAHLAQLESWRSFQLGAER